MKKPVARSRRLFPDERMVCWHRHARRQQFNPAKNKAASLPAPPPDHMYQSIAPGRHCRRFIQSHKTTSQGPAPDVSPPDLSGSTTLHPTSCASLARVIQTTRVLPRRQSENATEFAISRDSSHFPPQVCRYRVDKRNSHAHVRCRNCQSSCRRAVPITSRNVVACTPYSRLAVG
jgi:hypothetical protein